MPIPCLYGVESKLALAVRLEMREKGVVCSVRMYLCSTPLGCQAGGT